MTKKEIETLVKKAELARANAVAQVDARLIADAMQNALSPEAVAAIAWGARAAAGLTNEGELGSSVILQLNWFAGVLENIFGGQADAQKMAEAFGLKQ